MAGQWTKMKQKLLVVTSVHKHLWTAMNERVDDMLWIIERSVGERLVMEVGDIQMRPTEIAAFWLKLWPG